MNDDAIAADNSKNMENLRNARSYNDVVVVLTAIKSSAATIQAHAVKSVAPDENVPFDSKIRRLIALLHKNIFTLSVMELELTYAKTLDGTVIHRSKESKFNTVWSSAYNAMISAENAVYAALQSLVANKIPSELSKFVDTMTDFLSKVLRVSSSRVYNLPTSDAESYISCAVFKKIYGPDDFILSNTLFCIYANSNGDGSFSYALSFPTKPCDKSEQIQFSNQRKLVALLKDHLIKLFNVSSIRQLSPRSKGRIKQLSGVHSVTLDNGILQVKLESGQTGSQINNIITKLLSVLTTILEIDDPFKDVIHRMSVLADGTKAIQFTLVDRNFYNTNALDDLRRMLNLKPQTFDDLKRVAGVTDD